uniref:Uncharacterized protein n=1 Tax=Ditylenchus dipsaci TaxID=166011 RepID=A0A915CR54_9BILA
MECSIEQKAWTIICIVLFIQLANAFVEQVFSLCKSLWKDARNSLKVEMLKAPLQVRVNFDINCAGVSNRL